MKWSCGMIRDLLPLYQDEICSQESKTAVEEHIAECESCRKLLSFMNQEILLPVNEETGEDGDREPSGAEEKKRLKKSFLKIRRRWRRLLAFTAAAVILMMGVGTLVLHEYRGEGIVLSNLDEIRQAYRYMDQLKKGNYESVVSKLTYEDGYNSLMYRFSHKNEMELYYRESGREMVLGDTSYWIGEELENRYFGSEQPSDGDDDMLYLIANKVQGLVIPERVWEDIVGDDYIEIDQAEQKDGAYVKTEYSAFSAEEEYESGDNRNYILVDTQWGRLYVNGPAGDLFRNSCRTEEEEKEVSAYDIWSNALLVPASIYEAAEEGALAADQENAKWYEKNFSEVRDMSLQEYEDVMHVKVMKAIKEWEKEGRRLKNVRFLSAMRINENGEWEIRMQAEEEGPSGKVTYRFGIQLRDNKIVSVSSYGKSGSQSGKTLADALNTHYLDWINK